MSQPAGTPANGIAMRGADGSLYFIREEVMEACRVTEKDMADALGQLLGGQRDVAGFSAATMEFNDAVRVSDSTARAASATQANPALEGLARRTSTIMCPW